jgi:hypothetical protein
MTTPGGDETMVGQNAVTPWRGSAAANSPSRSGWRARSMPYPPLICTSTNPGATTMPAPSSTSVPGGIVTAAPTLATWPSTTITSARAGPSGATTVPPTTAIAPGAGETGIGATVPVPGPLSPTPIILVM